MLDEKRAAAAMKEAWRRGGYRFALCNNILSVRAEGWGFQGALENIPAKVLGLIAEHLGSFPEDNDAFEIKKDSPAQWLMLKEEATCWDGVRGLLDAEEKIPMRQTPLLLNGQEIWQEQRTLKTRRVNPDRTRIIDSDRRQEAEVRPGHIGTLLWRSMAGTIAYVMAEPDEDGKLERLDGWPWCGE